MSGSQGAISGETSARLRGRAFLAVPLVLVNLTAVWGQAGWAYDHFTRGGVIVALLFALSVESIGVYLAWESHEALMADQASAFLRFGSYAVGALVGILNYLHFSAQSPAIGVAFGALSAISPWLWGIWSRARNRTRLAELGLVDVRGVKLSTARKLWHPIRSVRVLSWAAWEGVTDPADAVAGWVEAAKTSEGAVTTPGSTATTSDTATTPDTAATTPGDTAGELEFVEPEPRILIVPAPQLNAFEERQVDPETVKEIDEIEIHRVMRDTKPRVSYEVAEIMVRDGCSRATAYRRAKETGRDTAALA